MKITSPLSLLFLVATACSSSTSNSSNADAGTGNAPSATQWCTGDGSEISGGASPTNPDCRAEYITCDGKNTLRVDCPVDADGGTLPCKCYTNGADGPTFDKLDTCLEVYKGHYEVANARFQTACGWTGYDLSKRVSK